MMFATRLLPLLAVLIAPSCGSAQAMDYEVGTSLICDTQTQVERFVAVLSGDTQAAIDAVNSEEQNPTACALIDVAYLRGAEIGMARGGRPAPRPSHGDCQPGVGWRASFRSCITASNTTSRIAPSSQPAESSVLLLQCRIDMYE
jgi:hypothetical protein